MGNDLVRFIQGAIGRPCFVSGLSSGGVLSAWLSAYAPPGLVLGAHYEDPPLFHSEINPACGQGLRQGIGPIFAMYAKYLGDQWDVGDWAGLVANAGAELHPWMTAAMAPRGEAPPQNLKEYDPEWARAFWSGSVAASCDHARMLAAVKVPVLFTHHFRRVDDETGLLMGALSDIQAKKARALVEQAGQIFDYRSFPAMGHSMHGQDPKLFASTLTDWVHGLG